MFFFESRHTRFFQSITYSYVCKSFQHSPKTLFMCASSCVKTSSNHRDKRFYQKRTSWKYQELNATVCFSSLQNSNCYNLHLRSVCPDCRFMPGQVTTDAIPTATYDIAVMVVIDEGNCDSCRLDWAPMRMEWIMMDKRHALQCDTVLWSILLSLDMRLVLRWFLLIIISVMLHCRRNPASIRDQKIMIRSALCSHRMLMRARDLERRNGLHWPTANLSIVLSNIIHSFNLNSSCIYTWQILFTCCCVS